MRIGFLLNHDQLHQVAHSLPIALALAELGVGAEVIVAVTSDALAAEVKRVSRERIAGVTLVRLGLRSAVSRIASGLLDALLPAAKLLVYRDNLDFFRSLDLLVVAEKTSLLLKTRFGLDRLRIVHTRHGAGDRAIGFDAASARFDHVLCSGEKIRDRLVRETGLDPARISVVGYPKFDLVGQGGERPPFDDGDPRPVVLYNPHPSPHLSSWYRLGPAVLDWFAGQDEYRLIFAPHVMLFRRPFVVSIDRLRIDRPGRLKRRWLAAPHIHIDLGSRASTMMTYTERADLYLGDVSSQIYEFLRRPRPAAFINAQHRMWTGDENYAAWRTGPVIETVDRLGETLAAARADHVGLYRPIQAELFARSFDLTGEASSIRAARAIAALMDLAGSA